MTERSVTHATFTLERTYDAPPSKVFAAFADPEVKARWFGGPPEWAREERTMDFRPGGHERSSGGPPGGTMHTFEAHYWDIVPDERIVLTYDMHLDENRISVSLQSIELEPVGDGTRLTLTEHGAYLDGYDDAGAREAGTKELLEAVATVL